MITFTPAQAVSKAKARRRRNLVLASTAGILTLTLTVDPFAIGSIQPVLADELSPFGLFAREAAFAEELQLMGQAAPLQNTPLSGEAPEPPASTELPVLSTSGAPGDEDEVLVVLTEPSEPAAFAGHMISGDFAQTTTPPVGGAPVPATVGGVDLVLDNVEEQETPEAVVVRIAGEIETQEAGVDGLLLDVTDASSASPLDPEVELTVDYESFAGLGGAEWASRLQFVWMPDCNEPTSNCLPQPIPTVNDGVAQTITAVVPVNVEEAVEAASLASTIEVSSSASAGSSGGSLAVTTGVAGPQGNWGATSLSPSSSWGNSGNTGAFTWSMNLAVPSPPAGPSPDLGLSYSSAASDGRLPTTNNQSGPVGEGFSLPTAFIERTYTPCSDDEDGAANNDDRLSLDLCWGVENATLSMDGSSAELVREEGTNRWYPKVSNGSKVERLTGASNNGQQGEYWKVTTTDGKQYFFGQHEVSNSKSAWTVPVFGNHPGEPCYDSDFKNSRCNQVYRWNLERVVDPVGHTMTYFYDTTTNNYIYDLEGSVSRGANSKTASYIAGGELVRISYGDKSASGIETPARVTFDYRPRCITDKSDPDSFCSDQQDDVDENFWPDSPVDLICGVNEYRTCSAVSPVFFSLSRLHAIKASVFDGDSYELVTSWQLGQTFNPQGDGLISLQDVDSPMLVLNKITETGHGGPLPDITRPSIDFRYTFLRNRVDQGGADRTSMPRPRLTSLTTETGATINVNYRTECGVGSPPSASDSAQSNNSLLCYAVEWLPTPLADPVKEYFHKYVVSTISEAGASRDPITEDELITGSLVVVTSYEYVGGAKWMRPTGALVDQNEAMFSDFRGFKEVVTTVGTGGDARSTSAIYFRGVGGDLEAGPSGHVITSADREEYRGQVFASTEYNGATPLTQTVTVPGTPVTVASNADEDGDDPVRVPSTSLNKFSFDGAGELEFRTRTETTLNDFGQVTQVNDLGDLSENDDDTCTQVEYASETNPDLQTAYLVSLVSSTKVTAAACDASGAASAEKISWGRADYDNSGRLTTTYRLDPNDDNAHAVVNQITNYDDRGRALRVVDAMGNYSTTTYVHSPGGMLHSVTASTPIPIGQPLSAAMSTTTNFDPLTGVMSSTSDANGLVTTGEYDALGRLVSVRYPFHPEAEYEHASVEYEYLVSKTGLNSVITRTLAASGEAQHISVTHYDGLLRPFQTQVEGANAGATRDASSAERGQLVTQTYYNSAGLVTSVTSPAHVAGAPSVDPVELESPAAQTTYEYDHAGRQTAEVFWVGTASESANEQWRSITHYDGAQTLQVPPMGGKPQMTIVDARGRTVELREFLRDADDLDYYDTAPEVLTLPFQSNFYEFDAAGRMVEMRNSQPDPWTFEYDFAGRQISTTDPDGGTTSSTYDALDRVVSRTNGNGNAETDPTEILKHTVAYTYDSLGRILSLHQGSASGPMRASWQYDTAVNEAGVLVRGALASSTRYIDGHAYTTSVDAYDNAYQPLSTTLTLPNISKFSDALTSLSFTTNHTYTADGQIASITHPAIEGTDGRIALGSEVVTTQFDSASIPSWMGGGFGWGVYVANSSYLEDGRLRLLDLGNTYATYLKYGYEEHTKRLTSIALERQGHNTPDLRLNYSYNDAGNITSISDNANASQALHDTQCFGYDGLQRLEVAWTASSGECAVSQEAITPTLVGGASPYWTTYSYDPLGNRTSMVQHGIGADEDITTTYEHGADGAGPHQLTSMEEAVGESEAVESQFAYDNAGNRVSETSGTSAEQYEWDVEGELVAVGGEQYAYDASGNRLLRENGANLTIYLPGGQEVQISSAIDPLTESETTTLSATRYYAFAGRMVAMRTSGGMAAVTSFAADHQGTLLAAVPNTNWAADAVQRVYTDPFGGTRGASDDLPGDRGFVGGIEDSTGLTFLQARYYDAKVGNFISVDPLLRPQVPAHWHAYAYGFNNPVLYSDASGLEPRDKNGNFDGNPYPNSTPPSTSWAALNACKDYWCQVGWQLQFQLQFAGGLLERLGELIRPCAMCDFVPAALTLALIMAHPDRFMEVASESVAQFMKAPWANFIRPYARDWQENPGHFLGGLSFDVATFVVPGGVGVKGIIAARKTVDLGGALARGGIGPVIIGQQGEAAVRAVEEIGEKTRFTAPSGQPRIADGMTTTTITEVKNVAYQGLTTQIQDYIDYVEDVGGGMRFDLWTRSDTDLSGPLQEAIKRGLVNHRIIPD